MIRFHGSHLRLLIILASIVLFCGCSSKPSNKRVIDDINNEFSEVEALKGVWDYDISDIEIHGDSTNNERLEVLVSFVIEGNLHGGYTSAYNKKFLKGTMRYRKFGNNWEYEGYTAKESRDISKK